MLAACARGAIGVDAAVGFVDLDVDAVINLRIDPDRRKARVATRIGIERRDAHEAMHPRFRLHPAMGIVALEQQGRGLEARFIARRLFDELDLKLASLRPARIHAGEHARPVAAFGTAGARVNFDEGVVGVSLAREQRLDLPALAFGLQGLELGNALGLDLCIALGFREFDKSHRVLELPLKARKAIQAIFKLRALAHDLLRGVGIVPEIGVFDPGIQFGQAARRGIDVKDASSAVPWTA